MDSGLKALLQPEVLNSMNGLELIARIIVEGFMSGSNKSQAIGIGQEFSQYRNYEPGDDLRQLDWKMYARSERYFIKQAEIETNITVKFMIDASKSMSYQEEGISKIQYAKVIAAALAFLSRKQGDTFGLYAVNDNQIKIVHPRFEQQQFMRFLHELVELKAESTWKKNGVEQLLDHHGKELLIFITDLYDDDGDLYHFMSRLKTSRNEVIVFHIVGKQEMSLDHGGPFTFKDLETGSIVKVDTLAQKKEYTEKIAKWIQHARNTLLEKGIAYQTLVMSGNPGEVLREFLKHRKKTDALMNFLNPIWLWGLLGLAIPIGIHLLSRKEGKTIYIGSLRHLIDSNTTRFSSLRLNEILLLLLRIALIVIAIFLIAGLITPFNNKPETKWLLIEKGIENDQHLKILVDSLQQAGYEARFFAKNFPAISDSPAIQTITNYNALLTDLSDRKLDEAVILSYTFSNQFRGERISLSARYRWLSIEPRQRTFIHSATKLDGDSLNVRTGETSLTSTAFTTQLLRSSQRVSDIYHANADTAQIIKAKAISVNVWTSETFEQDASLVVASLRAIASEMHIRIAISQTKTSGFSNQKADLNFWMSDEAAIPSLTNGIAFLKCAEQNQPILLATNRASLFCDHAGNTEWTITKRLTPENVLRENFTLTLAKIIAGKIETTHPSFPDHRALPTALAWSKIDSKKSTTAGNVDTAETYLAILLLLTLVAERWTAFKRNQ